MKSFLPLKPRPPSLIQKSNDLLLTLFKRTTPTWVLRILGLHIAAHFHLKSKGSHESKFKAAFGMVPHPVLHCWPLNFIFKLGSTIYQNLGSQSATLNDNKATSVYHNFLYTGSSLIGELSIRPPYSFKWMRIRVSHSMRTWLETNGVNVMWEWQARKAGARIICHPKYTLVNIDPHT